MTSDLLEAIERLHLEDHGGEPALEAPTIDDILFAVSPRKRQKHDAEELKADLEKKYLVPPTAFSEDWLNRLQQ